MKFTDYDHLIDEAIDQKPRARSAKTAAALAALLEAADSQFRARHELKQAFAAAADSLGKGTGSYQDRRNALRQFEGDYTGQDTLDMLTGSWIRRISNLDPALELTIGAVVEAVVLCDDLKSALAHFDAAAAKDRKIHAVRGRQLVSEFPKYGRPSEEDRTFDEADIARKQERRERRAK